VWADDYQLHFHAPSPEGTEAGDCCWLVKSRNGIQHEDLPVSPESGTIQGDEPRHGYLFGPALPEVPAACSRWDGGDARVQATISRSPRGRTVLIADALPSVEPYLTGPARFENQDAQRGSGGIFGLVWRGEGYERGPFRVYDGSP
jgi:hypothetical protein